MKDEFTPTDNVIRDAYLQRQGSGISVPVRLAEFDAWLAEHDRAVAEKAWDEAVGSIKQYLHPELRQRTFDANPHKPPSVSTESDAGT